MKKIVVLLILCHGVFHSCSIPEIKGTAIILGISTYAITSVPNLNYCDDDAEDVARLFSEQGYNVFKYVDSAATRANLELALRQADVRNPVVIYYSGHGLKLEFETSGVAPGYYMLPYGFAEYQGTNLIFHRENMLAISDIEAKAQELGIKHCIVIADCCYSGGLVTNTKGVSTVPDDYDPVLGYNLLPYSTLVLKAAHIFFSYSVSSILTVLVASGELEESYESSAYENGVFTEYFLRSINNIPIRINETQKNIDRDNDGYITTSELYLYIAICMNAYWNSTIQSQSNTKQIYLPHISDNAREYILFKVKR